MQTITARTDRGAGLALPLAKGISRIVFAHNAIAREDWPMTNEEVAAEIYEANQHFANMTIDPRTLSEASVATLTEWKDQIIALNQEVTTAARAEPEAQPTDALKATIKKRAKEAWSLLTLIDRELTGLTDDQTDPGKLP